jgi:broad specificity phosphatase PhoE
VVSGPSDEESRKRRHISIAPDEFPHLSDERKRLVELMQRVDFGCIDGLQIKAGQPQWEVTPQVKEIHCLTQQDPSPQPLPTTRRQRLSGVLRELFRRLDTVSLATVSIVVQHGHPIRLIIHRLMLMRF